MLKLFSGLLLRFLKTKNEANILEIVIDDKTVKHELVNVLTQIYNLYLDSYNIPSIITVHEHFLVLL